MPVGKKVVIIGGGIHGCQLAEFLVKRGRKVTILEATAAIGDGLVPDDTRKQLLGWLEQKGVTMMTGVKYETIDGNGVSIITQDGKGQLIAADTIIPAVPLRLDVSLFKELQDAVPEIYQVGDCKEPRLSADAIADGWEIACKI